MKKLSFIIYATILFVSCKSKDSLQSDKNIVVLTDTTHAAGSYLSDTGMAKMPVAVAAPVRTETAPVTRTRTTAQRTGGGTTTTTSSTSTASSGGGTTTTVNKKQGWSKSAKGAVIGGVGGAVAGAVIGKGKGAIIGGVLGAAGGYVIGRGQDKKSGRIP